MRVLGDLGFVKNFDKIPATIYLRIGIASILEFSSLDKWSFHFLQPFMHPLIHSLPKHSVPTRIRNWTHHLVLSRYIKMFCYLANM